MGADSKVVVIVIDGGTFEVMRPLIRKGDLPHLASLMAAGAVGDMISTVPFVTPTAFSSILTGANPGKHGIFDFACDSHGTYDTGPLVDRRHIRATTLWDLLGAHGRRVMLVTVPFTSPPPPVNGVMLCIGNVAEGPVRTYPAELAEEILSRIGGYAERHRRVITVSEASPSVEFTDDWIARCHYQAEKSTQATLYLMRAYPWDFLMTTLVITDRLQHYFWRCMDPNHPAYDPAVPEKYRNVIPDAYRKVDAALGEILGAIPEDAHVLVMSDHGFGSLDYAFLTNVWLREKGLLHLRREERHWTARTSTVERCLTRVGVPGMAGRLPEAVRKIPIPLVARRPRPSAIMANSIDWARTQAYATRWGININLRSREPRGIVEPGPAYDRLVEAVIRDLRDFRDPRSGKPLFDLVARRDEIYHGPYAKEAHDVLVASNGRGTVLRKDLHGSAPLREITGEDIGNGDHRREGIFILAGPQVEAGVCPAGPRLEDVAPTVLYLMGVPIPDSMDGRVLTSCIRQGFLDRQPVGLISAISSMPPDGSSPAGSPAGMDASEEDEEQIRAQLKGLGYLG